MLYRVISFVGFICLLFTFIPSSHAEGSRSLYPAGYVGSRADLEWTTNSYGPAGFIRRRTILNVYAEAGEAILLASSALGAIGNSNILLYRPGSVAGGIGVETIDGAIDLPAAIHTTSGAASAVDGLLLNCNVEQPGTGTIADRAAELAGPAPSGNAGAYTPCEYIVPPGGTGIYHVIIYGAPGPAAVSQGNPWGLIPFTGDTNKSSVRAWDITVRDAPGGVIGNVDIDGRVYSNYLALFTGNNDRPLNSDVMVLTADGFLYQTALNGLDPNGFAVYGNQFGFFDSDGVSPLYHDVVAAAGTSGGVAAQLQNLAGGTSLQRPQFPIFMVDNRPEIQTVATLLGIPTNPVIPQASALSFTGDQANTSLVGNGGTLQFTSNVAGTYEIVISSNIAVPDYDPTILTNRVLRGATVVGVNNIPWNGLDNQGNVFPVGNNYPFRISIRSGEYHFPLIDAENSVNGGPAYTLLNPPGGICPPFPAGCTSGFYDDRGYTTLGGVDVGTPNVLLCGSNPPATASSDLVNGFDTTSNQRGFGGAGGNANQSCLSGGAGNFGDAKGLDMWTYYSSDGVLNTLNIVNVLPPVVVVPPPAVSPQPVGNPAQTIATATPTPDPIPTPDFLEIVTQLPNTGELPAWRILALMVGGFMTLLIMLSALMIYRLNR